MNANYVFAFAVGIGIVAGLRAMTAPAAVAWATHLGWLNLHGSPLAFMGSTVAVAIFTLGAIGEYVTDKLPKTPSRTAPPGLIARIVTGGLSGACVCAVAGQSLLAGAVLGAIGAVNWRIWWLSGAHATGQGAQREGHIRCHTRRLGCDGRGIFLRVDALGNSAREMEPDLVVQARLLS